MFQGSQLLKRITHNHLNLIMTHVTEINEQAILTIHRKFHIYPTLIIGQYTLLDFSNTYTFTD